MTYEKCRLRKHAPTMGTKTEQNLLTDSKYKSNLLVKKFFSFNFTLTQAVNKGTTQRADHPYSVLAIQLR